MFHTVERVFLRVLLVWGLIGIVLGAIAVAAAWGKETPMFGERFLGAVGSQYFIWGAIDALLAGLGLRGLARRESSPLSRVQEQTRREKAVRTLRFNTKLDGLWIASGVVLLVLAGFFPGGRASLIGHGSGVITQAFFLLTFDLAFARRLAAVIDD